MARQKQYDYKMAGGDVGKMRRLYREWTRAANERIRVTARRTGASAYKHIVAPLEGAAYVKHDKHGNVIFKGLGRKPDVKTVREAFSALARFMQAKTSTVAGIKEVARQRKKNLNEMLRGQGLGDAVSEGDKEKMLFWLGSDEGRMAKQKFDSDIVIQAILLDIVARPQGGSIYERWQQFEESGQSLAGWIRDNSEGIAAAREM